MIKFALKEDFEQIKKLWSKTFGDDERDVEYFLERYSENVLVFKEERRVKGMLSLLPVVSGEEKGAYIYAAATEENERGRGINTKLLEYSYRHIKKTGGHFLVLVPANRELFEYYGKRGFAEICSVEKKEYNAVGFVGKDVRVKKIGPETYYSERHEYFKNKGFIEWSMKEIEYIWRIYKGNFFEITNGTEHSFAVCDSYAGMTDIKELFGKLEEEECIAAIHGFFGEPHVRAALISENEPYAMVYPKKYKKCYFNLAMD